MGNLEALLELCGHSHVLLTHHYIIVSLCVDPSDSLEGKTGNNCLQVGVLFFLCDLKAIIGPFLRWLIESLHDDSNTSLIMGIFSVVTIEIGDSLLFMLSREPILNKVLNLRDVHELNVVHMTILLPLNHHIGRDTLIAHGFRIRVMAFTSPVDLIADPRRREAVVALYLDWMYSLALELLFLEPVIKRNVSSVSNELFVQAVHAFSIGTVLAEHLGLPLLILQVHWCAV